jgi:DegV family protein with EDD domain
VNLSSKLSATIEAARSAAQDADVPVRVVDSLSVTMGHGLVVIAAAEASAAGADLPGVVAAAEDAARRLKLFGAIDTLENLKRGGRIGGARALVGSMLSIKPVIEVRGGIVEQESKQRTRGKSLRYLADKVKDAGPVERLAVFSADAPDISDFLVLLDGVETRDRTLLGEVGPVIGSHAGRGAIGVAYIPIRL